MKKALALLAVAAMTAMVLAGCAKSTDMDASLETGTANYDFTGKTIVSTNFDYITKTVEVVTTAASGNTTTTNTETKIAYKQTTTTLVFAADGTFTATKTEAYLAGADGDYRNITVTAGLTTTDTYYSNYGFGTDRVIAGVAGTTKTTSTLTGTWKAFFIQDSATDGQTVSYNLSLASSAETENYLNGTASAITAPTNGTSTVKMTYALGDTDSSTTPLDADYLTGTDYWVNGTKIDTDGAEKSYVYFSIDGYFSGNFLVQ